MTWRPAIGTATHCGSCHARIPEGVLLAVFRVVAAARDLPRCQDCASAMGYPLPADPSIEPLPTPQPSLIPLPREADVVTQGQLDARRAKRVAALDRWKQRQAMGAAL